MQKKNPKVQSATNALDLMKGDKDTLDAINQNYQEQYGFADKNSPKVNIGKGISREIVKQISKLKNEDDWMLNFRLKAYDHFEKQSIPEWGADLSTIDFQNIHYFVRATERPSNTWKDVPTEIKDTFEKLGIPQAERKFLAGVATQYESEVIYHNILKKWNDLGIVFLDTDSAYQKYPELFRKYFGRIIPYIDNKFAALNSAVWSGGSFIYVPKGVKVQMPLQAYFRINAKNMGQFERTLIIADEGSEIHYVEGCTAPMYTTDSLHSAVVEIMVHKNAKVRYTTLQNWSTNVYNLVTKRAFVRENGIMEWVDCNLGSKVTMKYPSVYLTEPGAHGEILSVALASKNQHIDAGAKVIHLAPNTSSLITSKSVSRSGGRASYRGLVKIVKGAKNSKSKIQCDALILDDISRNDTYPTNDISESDVEIGHEATVGKLNDDQLFYLMSRGLTKEEAGALIISGFIEPIVRELPMEYAMELNALINLSMEGSVG